MRRIENLSKQSSCLPASSSDAMLVGIKGTGNMKSFQILAMACCTFGIAGFAQADTISSFRTPSGNVHCQTIESDTVSNSIDCEVIDTGGKKPLQPRPADCDLDWGQRFVLKDGGRPSLVCAGDTVRESGSRTLAYGDAVDLGTIKCGSNRDGLYCRNADGHGFQLSRKKQKFF